MRHGFVLAMLSTIFLLIILSPMAVNAHSPSSVELDYDYEEQVLTVAFRHSVSNPNSHYVYFIEIWKNDVSYTTRSYDSQTNSSMQFDTFDVTAEDGDVLEVKGDCNQGGSITGSITVITPGATTTTTAETTTTFTSPPPDELGDITLWAIVASIGIAIVIVGVICLRRR